MNKIKTIIVPIETIYDEIVLKGELEYCSKDYSVKLIEPLKGSISEHLQYGIPVKYVLEKSEKPNCIEIDLLEKAKDILISIYADKLKG